MKNIDLATTVSVTSTYAGEFMGYIQAAMAVGKTLGTPTVTIMPNIPYKAVLKKLATTNVLAAQTCDFTDADGVTLSEKVLEVKGYQLQKEICKKDLLVDFEGAKMNGGDNLPPDFLEFFKANQIAAIGAAMENSFWLYDAIQSGQTVQYKADSTVNDLSGTTITASNVQAEIGKVVAKLATLAVWTQDEKPQIYVATDVYINYLLSLGSMGASNGFDGKGPNQIFSSDLYFAGVRIVEAPGLPSGQMVGAQKSNLIFATYMADDMGTIKVKDMTESDLSDNVRFSAKWKMASGYKYGADIVYYWIY